MSLGKAAAGGTYDRNTPRLADGTYVALGQLAFYEGDLYGASSTGVFKVPAGDVTKPVERVCSFPAGFKTKMTNSTILAGSAHSSFAVSAKGFIVPLQSADYQSALGLLKWDCSTEQLTPFGPAATGSARTFGFLQIQDIVVQGNTIYWLDRQEYSPAETWADSFFALKRTKL